MNKLVFALVTAATAMDIDGEKMLTCLEEMEDGQQIASCFDDVFASVENDADASFCAFKCTNLAIAKYWECAAGCVEHHRQPWCITKICPAEVVAFDVPCL